MTMSRGTGDAPGYGGAEHNSAQRTEPVAGYEADPATRPIHGVSGGQPRTAERRRWGGLVAVALVAGVVGGGVGLGGGMLLADSGSPAPVLSQRDPVTGTQVNAQAGSVQFAASKTSASTVDIAVRSGRSATEGTGVVLTPDGYVLTNNHVVESGGQISVTLSDGTVKSAQVVGTSPSYDLAVIKLDGASGLTPAELGKSSALVVGQQVVAIGSPLGLEGTVTSGIVSALNRTVEAKGDSGQSVIYNGIQTDASINSGNSGGPLVNLDGQVIGINSAILSSGQNSGNIGLGFAIPIDTASRVANELIKNGVATKPQLGIAGTDSSAGGAMVSTVVPGSAAEQAGIKTGETIAKVNGRSVSSFADLVAQISANAPGSKVALTVTDSQGSNPREVEVTLGSQQDKAPQTTGQFDSGYEQQDPFGLPYGSVPGGR
ncbi:trypsin-like peptidase domain-containing protein [Saccharopolyspora hirsuta]|uniref:Trypsin-like serine protease n=1 Tax=Saccharopolyspora hirsuta TaxID=1837 RepID=A0A5M7BSL0_SACHI|nr:trypsin-like peptidase domain-containing protein [Saccharopolyspora hirsuta]KAA5832782.1 trypsin-like serine protease [Saccharopolyspora hirsuta]